MNLMTKTLKDLLTLSTLTLIITFLVWLPHILALPNFWGLDFSNGFATIYRNFDGLEYIVIAKSFYNPVVIASLPLSLPANYFASHFPGYAIAITGFAPILGYLKSMLFVSLLSTILSVWVFYLLIRDFKLSAHPLFLSVLFLVLPARGLIVHSVGSSEPIFMLFILLTIYFFMKFEQTKQMLAIYLAGVFGLATQITRPPGILLFIALALYVHWRFYLQSKALSFQKAWFDHLKYFPLILMPVGLLSIFYLYGQTLGDFWAYFHSGDNIHLTFPPFQVFNKHQLWVGEAWLEDLIYIFALGFLGGVLLLKQKLYPLAFVVLTYLVASTFIAHRDISRYILPITPFLLISYDKVLTSKEFKIILPIILLAIYLYSQNFILQNVAPVPNLQPFN